MDGARAAPDGRTGGPVATARATADALARTVGAAAVVLVEGVSDQIAVRTAALRLGRDLDAERVVVLPIGGAHATARYVTRLGPRGNGLRLAGLYDAGEEPVVRRGLAAGGLAAARTRDGLTRLGFFACVADLEDELIRAAGTARVLALLDENRDLRPFRSLQRQPAWRAGTPDAQLRRFMGSGARRKLRYARLLVEALPVDRLPAPLRGVLAVVP